MKAFLYGLLAVGLIAALMGDGDKPAERARCSTDTECAQLESPFAVATAAKLIRERRAEIERRVSE